jgi:Fe-Mn family superoxide dismutase
MVKLIDFALSPFEVHSGLAVSGHDCRANVSGVMPPDLSQLSGGIPCGMLNRAEPPTRGRRSVAADAQDDAPPIDAINEQILRRTIMAYTLPPLPYANDALEPHIDAKTMEIHHDKHHAAYVSKVNEALQGSGVPEQSIEDLCRNFITVPEKIRTAVRNNGGGHANHSMFWKIMTPGGGGEPSGKLAEAINAELGGFAKFKEAFSNAADTRFGSGWAWLSVDKSGKLVVESTPNQDNPYMDGRTPIFGVDVWEHAYYLKYQNRRPDYLAAFWNVVNWKEVESRYAKAKG